MTALSAALLSAVEEDTKHMTEGVCAYARTALMSSLFKKFQDGGSKDRSRRAVAEMQQRHLSDRPSVLPDLSWARGFVHTLLDMAPDWDLLQENLRTGPGASQGSASTSGFVKLAHSSLSCSTPELYQEYLSLLASSDKPCLTAEKFRCLHYGEPVYGDYSVVVCVPKTADIDRVIAIEPTVNSLFQQGMRMS